MFQAGTDGASRSLADRILETLDDLTPGERRVGRAVLASFPASGLAGAAALARAAGTSPATVLRFVAKLGFDGLPQFHEALRAEIDDRLRSPFELYAARRDGSAGVLEPILESQLRIVSETLARLSEEAVREVGRTLMSSSTVWVMGGRFSQAVAHYLYAHLQMLRPDVRFLAPWPASIADQIVHAGRGDCLVVFDFRRYQSEAAFAAGHVKNRRGKVVVVTDPYLSPASHNADHTLIVSIEGLSLVDSYTAAVALVDVLVSHVIAEDQRRLTGRVRRVEEARATLARMAGGDYDVTPPGSPRPLMPAADGEG